MIAALPRAKELLRFMNTFEFAGTKFSFTVIVLLTLLTIEVNNAPYVALMKPLRLFSAFSLGKDRTCLSRPAFIAKVHNASFRPSFVTPSKERTASSAGYHHQVCYYHQLLY